MGKAGSKPKAPKRRFLTDTLPKETALAEQPNLASRGVDPEVVEPDLRTPPSGSPPSHTTASPEGDD